MTPMLPDEKKVIMIIAPENFRDEEYFHTRESLEKNGIDVYVASSQQTAISSIDKKPVEVDMLIDDITDDFDAIVIVGGAGAKIFTTDKKVLSLIKDFHEDEKVVAAICIAPLILANAGILTDKKITSWEGIKDELEDFGVDYTGEDVAIDGNIITASGPKSAYQFGDAIVEAIKEPL